jgi:hypothetical protein
MVTPGSNCTLASIQWINTNPKMFETMCAPAVAVLVAQPH